ncbi:MAG: alpha/beta fold hydrolase [Desulfurococcales archaeon]|nr:alpha/beta fold hydrolase [Desulfurococcales archaeon]
MADDCFIEKAASTRYGSVYVKLFKGGKYSVPIVLLHGFSFTSDVWSEIGLLETLCNEGIPFIAPDMPYGMKVTRSFRSRDPLRNISVVEDLLSSLNFGKSYLVGASLGGYISLRYAAETNSVIGMTLVAPVNSLEEEIVSYLKRNPIPILLIYGDKDNIVEFSGMKRFSEETKETALVVYEDAPHPSYLRYPERFNKDVITHYKNVIGYSA